MKRLINCTRETLRAGLRMVLVIVASLVQATAILEPVRERLINRAQRRHLGWTAARGFVPAGGAQRLSETYKIVPLIEPEDHQSAGIDGDSFHMGRVHSALIIVQFGELTANSILKVYGGATAGTKTTAITFRYRLADSELKTANGDNYGAWTESAALTLTAASYEDFTLLIEVDSDEMPADKPWLTLEIDSTASELLVSAVAVCRPRFQAHDIPTLIA